MVVLDLYFSNLIFFYSLNHWFKDIILPLGLSRRTTVVNVNQFFKELSSETVREIDVPFLFGFSFWNFPLNLKVFAWSRARGIGCYTKPVVLKLFRHLLLDLRHFFISFVTWEFCDLTTPLKKNSLFIAVLTSLHRGWAVGVRQQPGRDEPEPACSLHHPS